MLLWLQCHGNRLYGAQARLRSGGCGAGPGSISRSVGSLAGRRNVPDISQVVFRPFNIHRKTAPISTLRRRRTLLDIVVYQNRSVSAARHQADLQLRLRGLAGLCYNQEDSSAYYQSSRKVRPCHHLFSHLYEETCQAYPKSNGVQQHDMDMDMDMLLLLLLLYVVVV